MADANQSVIITALGLLGYGLKTYTINDQPLAQTRFSTIALWQWLREREEPPGYVLVLVTQAVLDKPQPTYEGELHNRNNFDALKLEAQAAGLDPTRLIPIAIELPETLPAAFKLFEVVEKAYASIRNHEHSEPQAPIRTVLDFTLGFRTIPLMLYACLKLLAVKNVVALEEIWYAKVDNNQAVAPMIDLSPALEMADWTNAIELWRRHGMQEDLARRLTLMGKRLSLQAWQTKIPNEGKNVTALATALTNSALPLYYGLPMEFALNTRTVPDIADRALGQVGELNPPLREELATLTAELTALTIASDQRPDDKMSYPLTQQELQRQRAFIAAMLKRQVGPDAVRLMREWLVSRVVFATYAPAHDAQIPGEVWLAHSVREQAAAYLGFLGYAARELDQDRPVLMALTAEQLTVGRLFAMISDRRNAIAHNGMATNVVNLAGIETKLADLLITLDHADAYCLSGWSIPRKDTILVVTPFGKSNGVALNAARCAWQRAGQPTELDVLIAPSEATVAAAAQETKLLDQFFSDHNVALTIHTFPLVDPFHLNPDQQQAFERYAFSLVSMGATAFVNLTGGTTVMGYMMNRLVASFRRAFIRVHSMYLIINQTSAPDETAPMSACEAGFVED